ncbi:MAG: sigma-54 dependent transcriptional regulator [Pseudomonadota bacterium]|nr:sigma-54 dependent transcriptional regulator [Pseudomonadota bacterium]
MSKLPILIADDQPDVAEALRLLLKSEGMTTCVVHDPAAALDAVKRQHFACALLDLNYSRDTTSGAEGLSLISELRRLDAAVPIIAMTAWGTIDLAVRALQAGAGDFVEKPWENQRLLTVLRNQMALGAATRAMERLDAENALLRGDEEADEFIAESAAMRPVQELIRRIAPSDANVLILGDNGTGKGVIANRIHQASKRNGRTLIKVNMGGISEHLFESEMFGHIKGAFTDAKQDRIGRFELADGGSLFLDEIGNIPMAQQPKLLRVLEDGELERVGSSRTTRVNVRVISATNADLGREVDAGRFRKDLMFRLNTVEIHLPALRERREDLPRLAAHFLQRFGRRYQREDLRIAPSALRQLEAYAWPGNVRELGHVIERAVLMASGSQIDEFALAQVRPNADVVIERGVASVGTPSASAQSPQTIDQAEEGMIRGALERNGGNVQKTAEALGLSRGALYRRLEKYAIRDV